VLEKARLGFKLPRPVKQRRALLESNPPRDNWIDGDEIESVSGFGEAKPPQMAAGRPLFQSLSMPCKTHRFFSTKSLFY